MNILIVDDDSIIRKWLSLLLNQIEKYEIKIFEASDGMEAAEQCANHPIDLMITDIKMPRLTGIEILEKLKAEKPAIRTVVLSSYDDFNLVRKALKSGAIDYIRKAEMTIEDIVLILDKVNSDIELEKKLRNQDGNSRDEIMVRKKQFCEYIEHKCPAIFDFLIPDAPENASVDLCVAIFQAQDMSGKYPPVSGIVNICDNTIRNAGLSGICVPWKDDMFVVNYRSLNVVREYQEEEFLKILETINSSVKKSYSMSIPYCINMICPQGTSYVKTFHAVLDEFDKRHYYGSVQASPISGQAFFGTFNGKSIVHSISSNLSNQNYTEAFAILKSTLRQFHMNHVSPTFIKEQCSLAFYIFYAHTAMFNAQDSNENSLLSCVRQLNDIKSELDMMAWMDDFERKFMEYITMIYNNFSPVIKSAVQYINNNYYKKLSLDDVAKVVFRNRTYFSQLFKKEVGINFHDYLEDVRIKNAIILINSGAKPLSEIPEYVGFSNQTYFSKVFKHYTGTSPAKFKKNAYRNA